MTKPLKQWQPFTSQLDLLQERGLIVENRKSALDYLERVGYYRLSGYWYPFRVYDNAKSEEMGKHIRLDTFVEGSRFEDVVKLYIFDKKLRLLAIDALERIEMAVRVDIAHLLGEKSPLAHKEASCLHGNFTKKKIKRGFNAGKTEHQVWLQKYESQLNRSHKEDFVRHHLKSYGDLPIWTAIEVWDFGMLSKLYAGMQHADMEIISKKYGAKDGKQFAQWLRSLNFIRNVSAHHSRLWNINIVENSSTPIGWSSKLNNKKPFFYFCLMQQFLTVICPNSKWKERLKETLYTSFPIVKTNAISLSDFGIIDDWKGWDLWL